MLLHIKSESDYNYLKLMVNLKCVSDRRFTKLIRADRFACVGWGRIDKTIKTDKGSALHGCVCVGGGVEDHSFIINKTC